MNRRGIADFIVLSAAFALAGCQQSTHQPTDATPDAADVAAADSQPVDTAATASTTDPADTLPVKRPVATDATMRIAASAEVVYVGASGYGALRFGMARDEVEKAMRGNFDAPAKDDCQQVHRVGQPDVSYVFDGGKMQRIDVTSSAMVAEGGGHVGMQADEIRTLYAGKLTEQPRKDVHGGVNLKMLDKSGSGLIFQTDAHGTVTSFHAGIDPALDRAEGCS